MVFFYSITLFLTNCKVSKFIVYLNVFLAGLFLIMFLDYFRNTYLKNRAIRKQRNIDAANKAADQRNIAATLEEDKRKSLEKKIG